MSYTTLLCRLHRLLIPLVIAVLVSFPLRAQEEALLNLNKPEREQWFTNLGFGMFIHWSMDVQLGMVISHSMVGASPEYLNRYVNELPKTFNPDRFDARRWARSAKQAGMNYLVFTAKHHNGYCMFDTQTTDFGIMHSPYGQDVTRMVVEACREEGLAVGLYFSPDDFYFLHQQGTLISRTRKEALASENPDLNTYVKRQMRELMTQYGPVDIVFLDGTEPFAMTELAKVCWELNPEVVVTRGAMETPEQQTPKTPIPAPWEACYTLGDQWQFRPTNERYKSAKEAILQLIDIRSKGGNFLLNFGPDARGEFPSQQEGILNEISLWMFVNGEAFQGTVPHRIVREGNIWYLTTADGNTAYAFINEDAWELGERKTYRITAFRAADNARISVLGHNGKVLEYHKEVDPAPTIRQTDSGMEITVMRAQRLYNDRKWNNPVVVRITGVEYP